RWRRKKSLTSSPGWSPSVSRIPLRPLQRANNCNVWQQSFEGTVAQISNLLIAELPAFVALEYENARRNWSACRLEIGDTADWKSALRGEEALCIEITLSRYQSANEGDHVCLNSHKNESSPRSLSQVLKKCRAAKS